MDVLRSVADMQAWSQRLQRAGEDIAFVPTMGNLHEGHLALVRRARREAQRVVVSIFVNPTQFGPDEDFERYPRSPEEDMALLRQEEVDACFLPSKEDLYPGDNALTFRLDWGLDQLCGPFRPGHFEGVLSVVARLFHALTPSHAIFGQKDAQQALLIRRMVRDFHFPLKLILEKTVREEDGLAMSSRNSNLSPEERRQALALPRALASTEEALRSGERESSLLEARGREQLEGLKLEYFSMLEAESLRPVSRLESGLYLLAGAIRFKSARLIDNRVFLVDGERVEEGILF
ncbi:MAG: pantoate--beta-alanine ligase [Candidatus Krumholzibacteria bacterium]|jgi:pantoate--beta-alanine ligase|nr:pantoate--beta-alanine ligase [Candidatus Krumholzibacteria bacterium]MDP6669218.1 pantoate--beta-alanine ligase [Candidatus Krumholzibacteria bacterium]MDP6796461.1 pantoate--beta-alanine ligase [Candidatus Krumholzibacteria bacterium]MDP7021591.1 pantoate--beta-alanine ligase [Candidatus Krumholzibacteria bacterium]